MRSRPTLALLGVVAAAAVAGGAVAAINRASSGPATTTASHAAAPGAASLSQFDLTAFGIPGGAHHMAGRLLDMLAADLGVTPQQLTSDIHSGETINQIGGANAPKVQHDAVQAVTLMLDAAVAKGVFTRAQANSLTHDAADVITQLMDAKLGLASQSGMPGESALHQLLGDSGQTPAEIESALRGGATLSEIAGSHAAAVEADASALVQQTLAAAVTEHVITGVQAASVLADATDAITQLMDAKLGLLAH